MLRCCDNLVEWDVAFAHLLKYLIVTDRIRTLRLDLLMELLTRKDTDSDILTSTCRQNASAPDVLITLSRVYIQFDYDFEAFLKFPLLRHFFSMLEDISSFKNLVTGRGGSIHIDETAFKDVHILRLLRVESLEHWITEIEN